MKKIFKLAAAAAMLAAPLAGAYAQCPGALIVNEVSKGTTTNGNRQFIELIAAGAAADGQQCDEDGVDVSGWIIDDNNGIFSNTGAIGGVAISGGHLRLDPNASLWKNFPKGALIVLFNVSEFDTTLSPLFNLAAMNANGIVTNGTAYFIAVGKSSLVQRNTTIPTASTPTSSLYCGRGTYTQAADLSPAGIPAACTGDGIQVRCPGCQTGLGEPSFYHGVSYGSAMFHVAPQLQLASAHISSLPSPGCATAKTFKLNTPSSFADAGADAAWAVDTATAATPGRPNSVLDSLYIDNIFNNPAGFTGLQCAPRSIPTGGGPGALLVTEISNGTSGSCEFVEILVANANNDQSANVDVRGWIIDDNSGNFNTGGCVSGAGIGTGHYRLPFESQWANVPVGTFLMLYNIGTSTAPDNCYNLPVVFKDSVYADGHHVYFMPIAASGTSPNVHLEMNASLPIVSTGTITNCDYCANSIAGTYTASTNWTNVIGMNNTADAVQVRCPGCNDLNINQPSFYHGTGYGTASSTYTSIPASAGNLGAAVTPTTGTGSAFTFTGTTVASLGLTSGWARNAATVVTIGSLPASSASFYASVLSHSLTLPSCGTGAGARMGIDGASEEVLVNDVHVYPNPAQESLTIAFPASDDAVSVKIMDLNGRVVMDRTVTNETKATFNVSQLNAGVYLYQVVSPSFTKSGKVAVSK